MELKDKVQIYISLFSVALSLWAVHTSNDALEISANQETARIERYIADAYYQPVISVAIRKCHQQVLGHPLSKEQNQAEASMKKNFSDLNDTIKVMPKLSPNSQKNIETDTLSLRYQNTVDHYEDIVDLRSRMSSGQLKRANEICSLNYILK